MTPRERLIGLLGCGPMTETALVCKFISGAGLSYDHAALAVRGAIDECHAAGLIEQLKVYRITVSVYRLTPEAAPMEPEKGHP